MTWISNLFCCFSIVTKKKQILSISLVLRVLEVFSLTFLMESKESNYESSYHQHRVDVMTAPDDHSIWNNSNELSSTPMYITVDTNEAFPEMPPSEFVKQLFSLKCFLC